jgi:hypothetical protein
LASIKRILKSGVPFEDLELTDEMIGYFEIEWEKVNDDDEEEKELLAILAHDRNGYSVEELAEMMEINEEQVNDICGSLDFLTIKKGLVSFISDSFRKFAVRKLITMKEKIINDQIRRMLEKPTTDRALCLLPSYLEMTQRHEEILAFTSEDFVANAIGVTQSLCPIKKNIEIAIKAASQVTRYGDLLKLGLEQCMINQLDFVDVLSSEIEAQMSLGNHDRAIHLANSCSLKEDRLHMLAIIAKSKIQDGPIPESLLEQLRNMYSQIDVKDLGPKAVEIAEVLIHSCPNLAVELIEKSICENEETASLDLAFTKLSLAAMESNKDKHTEDFIDSILPRIKNPDIKKFFQRASIFLGEFSASDITREVNKLDNIDDKLRLLRLWLISNKKNDDAFQIVEYALELAIKTSDYVPDAKVLREIAAPLPYIKDCHKSKQLLGYFDSQKLAIKKLGPTEDYIRLELICARAEFTYDQEKVRNRMVEIYYEIAQIEDIGLRALCLSKISSTLDYIDKAKALEKNEGLHSLIRDELNDCLDKLLSVTADHFIVTKSIIASLAKSKFHLVLDMIGKMNVEYRRDNGLLLLLETYLSQPLERIDFQLMADGFGRIAFQKLQGIVVFKTIQRLYHEKNSNLVKQVFENAQVVLSQVNKIHNNDRKCEALCYLYNIYDRVNHVDLCISHDILSGLKKNLCDTWELIDAAWVKFDVGFKVISCIADIDKEFAQEFMEKVEDFRESLDIKNYTTAFNLFLCNKLAIKAFNGLLDKNLDTREDIGRLTLTINSLPSSGERAKLWADLALVLYRNGRIEACKEIVNKKLRPLIDEVLDVDKGVSDEIIKQVSPALYCTHHLTAMELIDELPLQERDYAYAEICDFLLTKLLPGDPKEYSEGQVFDVSYDEILDLCEVLKNVETDFLIFHYIKYISDTINSKYGQHRYSEQQRINIADKLKNVVNNKLPNPRFIRHDGWKIVSLAELGRSHKSQRDWDDLISSVEDINNLADKAFILTKLAVIAPLKFTGERDRLVRKTVELVENVPILHEKIEHYELIADAFMSIDPLTSKRCIEAAIKDVLIDDGNNDDIMNSQKRLVDLAFKISPDFASHIAGFVDDDKARKNIKRNFQNRIKILEIKQELMEQKVRVNHDDSGCYEYSKAAWMALGSLYSGKCGTCDINSLVNYIILASKMPLAESYPLILWVIENAVVRFKRTDTAKTLLRPFFEATLQATFCLLRIADYSIKNKVAPNCIGGKNTSLILQPGERQNAIQFISGWLEENLKEDLIIVDQYFGPNELDLIKTINSIQPGCRVMVLTSQKHHERVKSPLEEYQNQWMKISDVSPPDVELVIIGVEGNGQSPIHDRWILTKGGGLRLGTSLNSLGVTKISEI